MKIATLKKSRWLLLAAMLIPLGGCEMSCRADGDNPVEELGDKIEDATD
ncbi:MAG TPA: hypothetical protein P5572_13485 [Phycisphaerae bacterium]|nr:hypothetical protein [Phycisphaerales bacterium]HRX86026.1 hypothetical protein [Phycisphaerae bacterium]